MYTYVYTYKIIHYYFSVYKYLLCKYLLNTFFVFTFKYKDRTSLEVTIK